MITQWFLVIYMLSGNVTTGITASHTITPMATHALCMEIGHKITQLPSPSWYTSTFYCVQGQTTFY